MTSQLVAFVFMAALVLGGGLGAVTSRNVAHAALFLLLSLGASRGCSSCWWRSSWRWCRCSSTGGAVTIVLLFALMLTRQEEFARVRDNPQRPLAAIAALALLGVLGVVFLGQKVESQPLDGPSIQEVGSELFTQWAIPFEVASLVLLVALIAAIIIARGTERQE